MEREQDNRKKVRDIYIKKETMHQKSEDGFVSDTIMEPANPDAYRTYHKGTRTNVSYIIDDPRITRPFLYGICGLFFIVGMVLLLCKDWIMSILFISVSLFGIIRGNKDIDEHAKELKKQGKDVTIDSKEEAKDIIKEFTENVKSSVDEVKKATYTKDTFKEFSKLFIPMYSILAESVLLIVAVFVNVMFSVFLFIGIVLLGIFYYKMVKKYVNTK